MIRFTDNLKKEVGQSLLVINAKGSNTLKKAEAITSLLKMRLIAYVYLSMNMSLKTSLKK